MKEHTIKPKKKLHVSLRMTCIIVATLTISVSAAVSTLLSMAIDRVFGREIQFPNFVPWVLLGLVLGAVAAFLLDAYFIRPIRRLDSAMRRVAEGDFTTQLPDSVRVREIRDLYANFNIMTRELSATEILQTDFVANVSHEFKTPINAIEGYVTLLQEDSTPQQAMYIEKILANTHRLSELVGNILLLSKLESPSIRLPHAPYRLDEQIRMALLLLEPKWSGKQIVPDVELEPISIVENEAMMQHVWVNLLDNAIKFSPEGGTIRLRLFRQEERICCTVQDSGPGIAEKDAGRIFQKFYQGDASRKSDGNGLGLALVQRIVEIAGGSVSAENVPEGGCRFTVTL